MFEVRENTLHFPFYSILCSFEEKYLPTSHILSDLCTGSLFSSFNIQTFSVVL